MNAAWRRRLGFVVVAAGVVAVEAAAVAEPPVVHVKVADRVVGPSTRYIGAGYGYDPQRFRDLGFNTVFFGNSVDVWEPENDTAQYGSLEPNELRKDPGLVPWERWDATLGSDQWRAVWERTRRDGIKVMIGLRNQFRTPNWAPNPPRTAQDWNEWWAHCYAMAYWLNVRNDYRVDDYQVLNEPNIFGQTYPGEGWKGTEADYLLLVKHTHDAIDHVYRTYLPGRTYNISAPAVSFPAARTDPSDVDAQGFTLTGFWIYDLLVNVPAYFTSVAYHHHASAPSLAENIRAPLKHWLTSTGHGHYDLWLTEWGASKQPTFADGVDVINQLMVMSRPATYVVGSHYYTLEGGGRESGLMKGAEPTLLYHAMKMGARAMAGAKPTYEASSSDPSVGVIATRDEAGLLRVVITNAHDTARQIALDLSELASVPKTMRLVRLESGQPLDVASEAAVERAGSLAMALSGPGAVLLEAVMHPEPRGDGGTQDARTQDGGSEDGAIGDGGTEDGGIGDGGAGLGGVDGGDAASFEVDAAASTEKPIGGSACSLSGPRGSGSASGYFMLVVAVALSSTAARRRLQATRRMEQAPLAQSSLSDPLASPAAL